MTSCCSLFTPAGYSLSHCLNLYAEHGFAFVFICSNPKRDVPRRRGQRYIGRIEVNRAPVIIALAQPQNAMFVIHHPRRRHRLHFSCEKERRRISVAEWLEHFVPSEKIAIKF